MIVIDIDEENEILNDEGKNYVFYLKNLDRTNIIRPIYVERCSGSTTPAAASLATLTVLWNVANFPPNVANFPKMIF